MPASVQRCSRAWHVARRPSSKPTSLKTLTAEASRLHQLVYGTSKGKDLQRLRKGVEVLVATPGRLCDLLTEDKTLLRGTKTLVLDEGDRLLDEGFERQVSQIIGASSRSRQTLCFSATMPTDLAKMLRAGRRRGSSGRFSRPSRSRAVVERCVLVQP